MRQNLTLKIVVSIAALVIAAVHIGRPEMKIDSITLVLLIVCALPWLQPLIKTVELLGVKLELQELQDKVAEAKGAAESASLQAGLAISATTSQPNSAPAIASKNTQSDVEALAAEYETIRKTQRSGDARTAAMTNVVRRMIELAYRMDSFPVTAALHSSARGVRLFAYTYLYARPDARFLSELVSSVTENEKEDRPFGQYWGLQSIGRVMSTMDGVPQVVKSKLQAFALKLPRGTDREYELKKILQQAS